MKKLPVIKELINVAHCTSKAAERAMNDEWKEAEGWLKSVHNGLPSLLSDVRDIVNPPKEDSKRFLEDSVHISNKACRHMYKGGTGPSRAGNCRCPPGRCWYREQENRRFDGLKALTSEAWDAELSDGPAEG